MSVGLRTRVCPKVYPMGLMPDKGCYHVSLTENISVWVQGGGYSKR